MRKDGEKPASGNKQDLIRCSSCGKESEKVPLPTDHPEYNGSSGFNQYLCQAPGCGQIIRSD